VEYDVVVAGVGVAGAFVLNNLAKEIEAVGIDRRERLGYPVECGEIIPTYKEMKSLLPDVDDHSLFRIPERFAVNRTTNLQFVLPNGRAIDVDFEMLVLKRDEMIQEIVRESGKKLILGRRFDYRQKILFDGEEIYGKVIVASDGVNSVIRRRMGLGHFEISPAKQFVVDGFEGDEDTVYMFVGKRISPGGYAWIIPKGNGMANVGVGFRHKFAEKGDTIHRAIERFVREWRYSSELLKNAVILEKISSFVPIDLPMKKAVRGNVLFVGDSASMVISHVGAGIPTSMLAGKIAGEIVSKHILEGESLERYDLLWRRFMIRAMENGYFIKRLWDRMAESDERISRLFRLLSKNDMGEILRCKVPFKVRLAKLFFPIVKMLA